jgi:hypothetical protein
MEKFSSPSGMPTAGGVAHADRNKDSTAIRGTLDCVPDRVIKRLDIFASSKRLCATRDTVRLPPVKRRRKKPISLPGEAWRLAA